MQKIARVGNAVQETLKGGKGLLIIVQRCTYVSTSVGVQQAANCNMSV
jgi:propanediol dehydratase large subunit